MSLLRQRLAKIRRAGSRYRKANSIEDVLGIAAPIRDANGVVVVAVGVGALATRVPRNRLKGVKQAVIEAAATITERLVAADFTARTP